MKRTILFALMALAAASCEIYNPSAGENERTGLNLAGYTNHTFKTFVMGPADDLIFMLTLDEFIRLTPEEQNRPYWANFRSMIQHYTDSHLKISPKGIEVDTRGVSIRTPGSYWIMTITSEYLYSYDSGYDYRYYDQYSSAPGHGKMKRIACTGENRYEITDEEGGRDILLLSVEATPESDGEYVFSCTGAGRVAETRNGQSSTFTTNEFIYRKYDVKSDESDKTYSAVTEVEALDFKVETFHEGQPLDWCIMKKEAGGNVGYESNLEIKPVSPPLE